MFRKSGKMRIFRHYTGVAEAARNAVVALGNFDGVHRGHQQVIGTAAAAARAAGAPLAVLTFEPHPRRFFRPDEPPFQLTPLRSKVRYVRSLGVDAMFIFPFDHELSQKPADQFVADVLVNGIRARHLVVGYDFVFGKGRTGDVAMLRAAAARDGFGLTSVEPVRVASGEVYSSTNIRRALVEGKPAAAAQLLGRCWEIEGRVEKGQQRGRTIGFPTANVPLDEYIQPALGVYAVWAGVEKGGDTEWHMGVANIGWRPTFEGNFVNVEVYLFDYADDLYGQMLRVALVEHVRPEKKFDGIAALRDQIAQDCNAARTLLEGIGEDGLLSPPRRACMI